MWHPGHVPLTTLNVRDCELNNVRAVLRGLDALEVVNSEPAAEFLKRLDGK